jgi:hypothetical protein
MACDLYVPPCQLSRMEFPPSPSPRLDAPRSNLNFILILNRKEGQKGVCVCVNDSKPTRGQEAGYVV